MYKPTNAQIWSGRIDGTDSNELRWHQFVQCVDLNKAELPESLNRDIVIIGFCCDEGVRRNNGRLGAKKAPDLIRKYCSNFPVLNTNIKILDIGSIHCNDLNLDRSFNSLSKIISLVIAKNYFPIVLGGGHEVTYGVFKGVKNFLNQNSFGVINFDAHFDLREINPAIGSTSGTSIYKIDKKLQQINKRLDYLPIGIQTESNTRKLFEIFESLGCDLIMQEDFNALNDAQVSNKISRFLGNNQQIHLTVDMDVFNVNFATGVSAPNSWGILPDWYFKKQLQQIIKSNRLLSFDIAETNPDYDAEFKTIKLSSSIIFEVVRYMTT